MTYTDLLTPAFRALSARLGQDPLQVQGPGGNTSIKNDDVMWIKASGTELAQAVISDIFVAVDRRAALAEAREEAGDGSCKSTVIDPAITLPPSIGTPVQAALGWPVVVPPHSAVTIAHSISPQGRAALDEKLADIPYVQVPYAKPGLPLTREILAQVKPETQVIILQNHGLICCGETVDAVSDLIGEVERRLQLATHDTFQETPNEPAADGFLWSDYGWLACNDIAKNRAVSGTYYPDHVVFLGPALPTSDHDGARPAVLHPGKGVLIREGATPSQLAMLKCLSEVLSRVPADWQVQPIGPDAEASLLNWDAEKYRQALAART